MLYKSYKLCRICSATGVQPN